MTVQYILKCYSSCHHQGPPWYQQSGSSRSQV